MSAFCVKKKKKVEKYNLSLLPLNSNYTHIFILITHISDFLKISGMLLKRL